MFAAVHAWLISDIWVTAPAMAAAGAACGLSVAWSFGLLVEAPTVAGWVRYTLLYVAGFGGLGAASVLAFEPVTTMAAVVAANEPPEALFAEAMPLTIAFTVAMAALVGWRYRATRGSLAAVLLTCALLVLLLGLNISAIGLVHVPSGSAVVIAELFGLTALLAGVYAAVFVGMERSRFLRGEGAGAAEP